jgi:hypothetical protein
MVACSAGERLPSELGDLAEKARKAMRDVRKIGSIVVVWSTASVKSTFVQEEADEGRRRKVLVPIRIDDVQPPMGFRSTQHRDFIRWNGLSSEPEFQGLVEDVTKIIGPPPGILERDKIH